MKRTVIVLLLLISVLAAAPALAGCGSKDLSSQTTTKQSSTGPSQTTETTKTIDSTSPSAGTVDAPGSYQATATSYKSATKTITIKKVTTGSGNSTITYYVADVRLTDGLDLQSALSSGKFGGKALDTSVVAETNKAVLAVNGDYYSARSDGIMIRDGVIYRDKPSRQGLAFYTDGVMKVYDEKTTTAKQLLNHGVRNTFSFGPGLLVNGAVPEGISTYAADPDGKHNIQGHNPRTGIGMIKANRFLFVVVDGRQPGYSQGVTMAEFAKIFQDLGCTTAYNLDGGGSSTLYFMGKILNKPSGKKGERSISDILYIN
jgi:exopolysaccharide biosynthesis protein